MDPVAWLSKVISELGVDPMAAAALAMSVLEALQVHSSADLSRLAEKGDEQAAAVKLVAAGVLQHDDGDGDVLSE